MKSIRPLASLALLLVVGADHAFLQQPATPQRPPIIDMHVHAFGWDHMGNPPPPNIMTRNVPTARTDKEFMDAVLAELKRHNVVKAVAGGPRQHVLRWQAADPDRIIGGTIVARDFPLFDLNALREDVRAGRVGVMGELALAYSGVAPNDPRMEPYWALAEELDIPVALHTGLGPANTPYQCCPQFRTSLGNPALLEEVLVRHPKLRVYLMHAGYPYLQETIAILHMYPQVYADLGAISWTRPREAFHNYLHALVREGFGKQLMFGSDQMMWPEAIGMAIQGIESAGFLTAGQKRDIFYNNAVRFLRLDAKKLVGAVVAGEAQPGPTLNALTVPGEALPSDCALEQPAPRPAPSSRAEGTVIRSVESSPFPTNPWSGRDRTLVAKVRRAIDGTPRLPDGPPLEPAAAATFLLKLADGVVEAYRATYVSDGSQVDVWAVRFNDDELAKPERLSGTMNLPRGFRSRLVRGATVVLVTAPSSNACVRSVDGYIRSLK